MTDYNRLVRRLETIAGLNDDDKAALRQLPLRKRAFEENRDLVSQGDKPTECCVILEGLAARYKIVSGGRRQIISLHFAGDLPDLQSLYLDRMDHGLFALTPVRAAFIPHESVRTLIRRNDRINDILIRYALIDAAIFRQWIANVGRPPPTSASCTCSAKSMSACGLWRSPRKAACTCR